MGLIAARDEIRKEKESRRHRKKQKWITLLENTSG